MKQGFWRRDRFAGLAICALIIGLSLLGTFNNLERSAYDTAINASSRTANPQIAIIAIDDASLQQLGAWPWSRDIHARLYDKLSQSGAKVIAQSNFFFNPQNSPALNDIDKILGFVENSSLSTDFSAFQKRLPAPLKPLSGDLQQLKVDLQQARNQLQSDAQFAQSLANTSNSLLAMKANTVANSTATTNNARLPAYIRKNILRNVAGNPVDAYPLSASEIQYPIRELATAASGLGILAHTSDTDGIVRSEPLLLNYDNQLLPSMSLLLAARSLNLSNNNIRVLLGKGVELGSLNIKTDAQLQMKPFFYQQENAFSVDSYADVLEGRVSAQKFRGKIVLIGTTSHLLDAGIHTPVDAQMPQVLMLANSVSSILNNDFYYQPSWANAVSWAALAIISLYIILLLPRLSTGLSTLISLILLSILLAGEFVLLTQQQLWLPLMNTALLLLLGHLLLSCTRCSVSSDNKSAQAQTSDSHRMLGLSLQGQGQLDAAFEKFKMLPANKEALDVIYNLALDFERQQQPDKAVVVYQYAADIDPGFRDIQKRLQRARGARDNANSSPAEEAPSSSPQGTEPLSGSGNMLGRYEIEKELGKGAMGAVYLGKDPKIGRIVAIKTMALAQEYEGDELDDVKERFFREAETAGRLSHPNIVTIYDAGDENDLAYIAMEFIKGSDMLKYCKPDALLPVSRVLSVVLRAADALDFAHKQNVVHRDIKPANLMYDADTDTLKITDFGIARITDSSKTKTGMVLGTPSYMSPEQLAGKKVDGRSDLFSLGVMMFQMLTGRLPFQGESMAALMYKIANETHPSPDSIRPELHRCTGIIINRALAKDRDKRYKSGAQMAADLRKCMQIIAKEEKA